MARSPAPLAPSDRVLLIRLGAVGDVLRTLPALHLIKRAFPGLHLSWLVEDRSREILEGHPEIDEVIRFPRHVDGEGLAPLRLPGALHRFARALRQRRYGVAIDAQGTFKSGALAALSGARRRIGLAPGHCREMSFLFTNEWVRPPTRWLNRVERNLLLAESIGAAGDEVQMVLPERPEEAREAGAILRQTAPGGEPIVILSPGASRLQAYKMWPAPGYARLAGEIRRTLHAVPLVVWGPGEEELARAAAGGAGGAAMAPRAGLKLLAALLRRSAAFVGADTGPMHLAWGVGCPAVALFGPTDPRLNAPLGPGHIVVRGGRSMDSISAEEVLAAVRAILERSDHPPRPVPAPRLSRAVLFPPAGSPS